MATTPPDFALPPERQSEVFGHPQLHAAVLSYLWDDPKTLSHVRALNHDCKGITERVVLDEVIQFIRDLDYPVSRNWFLPTAQMCWALRLYEDSADWEERVVSVLRDHQHPYRGFWWSNLGCVLDDETIKIDGQDYTRKDCFIKALTMDPSTYTAWSRLGAALPDETFVDVNGESVDGPAMYLKAIALTDDYAPPWNNLRREMHGATVNIRGKELTREQVGLGGFVRERTFTAKYQAWRDATKTFTLPEDPKEATATSLIPFTLHLMSYPNSVCEAAAGAVGNIYKDFRSDPSSPEFQQYICYLCQMLRYTQLPQVQNTASRHVYRLCGRASLKEYLAIECDSLYDDVTAFASTSTQNAINGCQIVHALFSNIHNATFGDEILKKLISAGFMNLLFSKLLVAPSMSSKHERRYREVVAAVAAFFPNIRQAERDSRLCAGTPSSQSIVVPRRGIHLLWRFPFRPRSLKLRLEKLRFDSPTRTRCCC